MAFAGRKSFYPGLYIHVASPSTRASSSAKVMSSQVGLKHCHPSERRCNQRLDPWSKPGPSFLVFRKGDVTGSAEIFFSEHEKAQAFPAAKTNEHKHKCARSGDLGFRLHTLDLVGADPLGSHMVSSSPSSTCPPWVMSSRSIPFSARVMSSEISEFG